MNIINIKYNIEHSSGLQCYYIVKTYRFLGLKYSKILSNPKSNLRLPLMFKLPHEAHHYIDKLTIKEDR